MTGKVGLLGEISQGFAVRDFVYNVCHLIAVFPAGQSMTQWPPGKNRTEPWGRGVTTRREPRLCCS